MTPLARGIVSSANLGGVTTAVYNTFGFNNTDYINSGNPVSLQITGDITVAMWVKDTVDNKVFFSKYNAGGNQRSWILRSDGLSGGKYEFFVSADGAAVTTLPATTNSASGNWNHLVGVSDGTNILIYVNGSLENSTPHSTGIFNSSTNITIGGQNNSGIMVGSGTQPLIFDSALSAPEVASLYGVGNKVITFAKLPGGIQTKAAMAYAMNGNDDSLNDLSANSNNGTAQNSASADGDTQTFII